MRQGAGCAREPSQLKHPCAPKWRILRFKSSSTVARDCVTTIIHIRSNPHTELINHSPLCVISICSTVRSTVWHVIRIEHLSASSITGGLWLNVRSEVRSILHLGKPMWDLVFEILHQLLKLCKAASLNYLNDSCNVLAAWTLTLQSAATKYDVGDIKSGRLQSLI